jgi:hypothetical protein
LIHQHLSLCKFGLYFFGVVCEHDLNIIKNIK